MVGSTDLNPAVDCTALCPVVYDHITEPGAFRWGHSEDFITWSASYILQIDPEGRKLCIEVSKQPGIADNDKREYTICHTAFSRVSDWDKYIAGNLDGDYCSAGYS